MPKPKTSNLPKRAGRSPTVHVATRRISARYDAAQTTDDNRKYWAGADGLSPSAAITPAVRRVLRNRGRYESANNSYLCGIKGTIANETVGGGPRLQILNEDASEFAELVEDDFAAWAQEINLAEKLRTMVGAGVDAGESFGVATTNPGLTSDVKLDLRVYEAEQIDDPSLAAATEPGFEDGIRYDEWGNPVSYRLLRAHPGATQWVSLPTEYDDIPARYVLHYYRPDRPGQRRGIPEATPALPLFSKLRSYTLSVVATAHTASGISAVIETDAPANAEDAEQAEEGPESMDAVELPQNVATVLPYGTKIGQLKPEQPTTTYGDFVTTLLREICRCMDVPLTVGAMDAAQANMSSAYVVGQGFVKSIEIRRARLATLLNRLIDIWLTEWIKVRRPANVPDRIKHQWFWPQVSEHADPQKVANAAKAAIQAGVSNIPREYAKKGLDWEKEDAIAAKSYGVSVEEYRKARFLAHFPQLAQQQAQQQNQQTNEEDDEDEE